MHPERPADLQEFFETMENEKNVDFSSINTEVAFFASRYDKGEADYINCPMDKEEYDVLCKNQSKFEMKRHYLSQSVWRTIDLIVALAIGILFYFSYNEYIVLNISYGGLYLFFILH